MEASFNLYSLPNELIPNIVIYCEDGVSLKLVDKKLSKFSEIWFKDVIQELAELYPPLKNILKESTEKHIPAQKIFMRMVNNLHDTAKAMNCDIEPSDDLKPFERLIWEGRNYKTLLNNIRTKELKINSCLSRLKIHGENSQTALNRVNKNDDSDLKFQVITRGKRNPQNPPLFVKEQ